MNSLILLPMGNQIYLGILNNKILTSCFECCNFLVGCFIQKISEKFEFIVNFNALIMKARDLVKLVHQSEIFIFYYQILFCKSMKLICNHYTHMLRIHLYEHYEFQLVSILITNIENNVFRGCQVYKQTKCSLNFLFIDLTQYHI